MGAKVKGIRAAKANLDRLIGDIQGRKAVRALTKALIIISIRSAIEVPRETSTLLNSQFREIGVKGSRIIGIVGYTANYALAVHEAPGKYLGTNTPRPTKRGESSGARGVIWGPGGKPKFLEEPARNSQSEVEAAIREEMKL